MKKIKLLYTIVNLTGCLCLLAGCASDSKPFTLTIPLNNLISLGDSDKLQTLSNTEAPSSSTASNLSDSFLSFASADALPGPENFNFNEHIAARFGLNGSFNPSPDNNGNAFHVTGNPGQYASVRLPAYNPSVLAIDENIRGNLFTTSIEVYIPENSNMTSLKLGLRFYSDLNNSKTVNYGGLDFVDEFSVRIETDAVDADINTTAQYQTLTINSVIPEADNNGNAIEMFDINLYVEEIGAAENADDNLVSFHIRNIMFSLVQ